MLLAFVLLLASDTLTTAERARARSAIVFVSEREGTRDVRMISTTGRDDRPLLRTRYDEYPASVSADGTQLAVVSARDSANRHFERIGVVHLADGAVRYHHVGITRARNPSWSRDGRWLAVESDAHGFADVLRVDVSGAQPARRITAASEGSFEPVVSPRGDAIAFVTSRDGDAEVYVMRPDGGDLRRLTAFHRDDWAPAWSPDGRRLAFLSAREGAARVFVVDRSGTRTRSLTPRAAGEIAAFAWSPDGRRIAYVARAAGERARIWVVDVATGVRRPLTDPRTASTDPAWSPDGRYLAFASDRDGDGEIYLMRADGSGQTRLTRAKGADWRPLWVPQARGAGGSR